MRSKEKESPLVKKNISLIMEKFLLNYILYAVLAAILVCFACLNSNFLTVNNILNNFDKYAYLLVCACGTTIVLCGGGFDLSTGGVLAALTVLGGKIMVNTRNIWLGIGVMVIAGMLIGLINGLLIVKFNLVPFLETIAMGYVVRGLAQYYTQSLTISGLPTAFTNFAWNRFLGVPALIWVGILVFAAMVYVLHHTGYGRRIFAVGGNQKASYIMGIDDKRISVSIYALNGALIGIGAAMTMAKSSVARATTGTSLQMYCTAVAVIGGTSLKGGHGNLFGTLLGVAIYSLIISGLNAVGIDAFWQEIMTGAIIIFAAMIDSYKTRSNA